MLRRNFIAIPAAISARRALEPAIRKEIRRFPGEVSLFALNLDSNASIGVREDDKVRTASTIKLAIMVALFQKVASGEVGWDETVVLRGEDKVSGSGVLHELSGGIRIAIRDLMHLMIVVSDNTATNLILDRISADSVNECMDRLRLPHTRSLRKVRGDGDQLKAPSGWSRAGLAEENKRFGLGVSTPREMVALLQGLEKGEVVSASASAQMLEVLKRQQFKDGIGRRLSKYVVASKSGSLDALRSDVGIVYTPRGRIATAITVDSMKQVDYSEDNPGLLLIARLSETIVEGL